MREKNLKIKIKNSKLKTFVIVFGLVILVIGLRLIGLQNESSTSQTSGVKSVRPDENKIELTGIKVNDFTKSPIHTGTAGELLIIQNAQYEITYFPQNIGFLVVILTTDFDTAKSEAENALQVHLGVSKEEMCKLTISITTPRLINPAKAGGNFSVNGCNK